jgi:large subunit ribosomal protein L24
MLNIKAKIKKGDEVIIIAGKDKGKRGTVLKVNRCILGRSKVLVEGVNMIKKHTRPNPQANQPGGIIEKEAFIGISNVMLYNPATKKGDRVGFRTLDNGDKVRYFKSTGDIVSVDEG